MSNNISNNTPQNTSNNNMDLSKKSKIDLHKIKLFAMDVDGWKDIHGK